MLKNVPISLSGPVMNIKLAFKLCHFGRNGPAIYTTNYKLLLIRPNFEGPQEFVLKGVHCISHIVVSNRLCCPSNGDYKFIFHLNHFISVLPQ